MKVISTNPWTYVSVGWLNSLLRLGKGKPLEESDLPLLNPKNRAESLNEFWNGFWSLVDMFNEDPKAKTPSAAKAIIRSVRIPLLGAALCTALQIASQYAIPLAMGQTIRLLQGSQGGFWFNSIYAMAAFLFVLQILSAVFATLTTTINLRISQVLQSTLTGTIYEKNFRLSTKSRQEYDTGTVLTMVQQDIVYISSLMNQINLLWSIPLKIALATMFLHFNIGASVWPSLGVVLLSIGVSSAAAGPSSTAIQGYVQTSGARTNQLREILNGIKVVKFLGMEDFFKERVNKERKGQVSNLRKLAVIICASQGFTAVAPALMPVVSFSMFAALGGTFSSEVILPSLLLFEYFFEPMLNVEELMRNVVQGKISWERVTKYLNAKEYATRDGVKCINESNMPAVALMGARFEYEKVSKGEDNNPFALQDISLDIEKGTLVGIVGSVGSGKSTFLNALIGQIQRIKGEAYVNGKIAYCSQQPWIMAGTIEKNILFGSERDQEKLDRAVSAACLKADLESLTDGLATEIGENGVNISGGQKARVALARAIYLDADIYLLDDPVAALDAQVGKSLFSKAIKQTLKDKTVLFVTHQLQFIQEMDKIIVLENGCVAEYGTFAELNSKPSGSFMDMMKNYAVEEVAEEPLVQDTTDAVTKPDATPETKKPQKQGEKFVKDEDRKKGSVKRSVYLDYLKNFGTFNSILFVLLVAAMLVTKVWAPLWIAAWSADSGPNPVHDTWYYLKFYTIIGAGLAFANWSFFLFCWLAPIQASVSLEKNAMNGLFRSPLSFFESQPVGRILSRLASDVSATDIRLANIILNVSLTLISLVVSLVLISQSTWYLLILLLVLMGVLYMIYRFYQPSNLELKRLVSITKSPLISHLSESFSGIATIRAYRAETIFVKEQRSLMDRCQGPSYLLGSLSIWLNLRLSLLSAFVTLGVVMLAAVTQREGLLEAAKVGISITYAVQLTGELSHFLNWIGHGEAEMNAVERLSHYGDSLDQEAPLEFKGDPSLDSWPTKGSISFRNVEIVYASRPEYPVIKNFSIDIQQGEKIGFVGRTGSGKSTLVTALFRIMELNKGVITIDGVDISKLGLKTLRSRMQMIAQEPVLFSGTLRSNLDIRSQFGDDEIWNALELVGLKDYISQLDEKLDAPVSTGGDNLSSGQRQLICLARAILVKPKLMIMDEASSAVDNDANTLIQEAIQNHFRDTTIISIAHRLNTIASFDRVLVLQDGELAEFDSPHALLSNPDSLFSSLTEASGSANAAIIRDIASTALKRIE